MDDRDRGQPHRHPGGRGRRAESSHRLRAASRRSGDERFSASTGLDHTTIASLIEAGRANGLVDLQDHAVGIFYDPLPTADALQAMGLSVSSRYRPEDLRSHEDDPREDRGDAAGSSWTMSW